MSDRVVLDLRDVRPIWSVPGWVVERVREVLPAGWEVRVTDDPRDGTGDAGSGVAPTTLEAVREARVYMGLGIPEAVLEAGAGLEWTHTVTAGVGGSLTPEMLRRNVILTNSAGIHAVPVAETVIAAALHFLRGLDFAVEGTARGSWWPDPFLEQDTPVTEMGDSIVGILGYGGIGREVARRSQALGARVLALRRTPPDGSEAHAEVFHGPAGLVRVLARSDVLVVCLPETPDTRGILDRETISRMKRGAVLINVGRGGLLDDDALVEALEEGRLRGAALDAFVTEPLPDEHPLWSAPNLLITPHVSAVSRRFWERQADLVTQNLERFVDGRPLLNVVDKQAGY